MAKIKDVNEIISNGSIFVNSSIYILQYLKLKTLKNI